MLCAAGGLEFESAMRCAATRFGTTSVRLFANAVTWDKANKPKGLRAFSADEYRLPLPDDPGTLREPGLGQGFTAFGTEEYSFPHPRGFRITTCLFYRFCRFNLLACSLADIGGSLCGDTGDDRAGAG